MTDNRLQRRRKKLWDEDPRCRRCFEVTILPEDIAIRYGGTPACGGHWMKHVPSDLLHRMATIQHMRSRLNPFRGSDFKESTTLYCHRCNQLDAAEEQLRVLGKTPLDARGECDGCTKPKTALRRACACGLRICVGCQRSLRHMLHRARAARKRIVRRHEAG